jgi:DNA polymerase III delta subunit
MLYLIKGEEPFLIQEAIENTFASLQTQGYAQKKIFTIDSDAALEAALLETRSPSLFDEGKTVYFLKISGKKLKKLPENAKVIEIPPMALGQFPFWLDKRLQKAGFKITVSAKQLFCDHFEGNILAAHQCIEKLKLLYPQGQLTEEQVMTVLSPSARYTVFDLMHHLQPQHAEKAPKILLRLQEEGVEPAIVLWGIARECRRRKIEKALPLLAKADEMIKGIQSGKPWEALMESTLFLVGRYSL